eukprot:9503-Heterococcus_DN1.PRE.2
MLALYITTTQYKGGAVFLSSGSTFGVTNSEMNTNSASNNGGAIAAEFSTLVTVSNCSIRNCQAVNGGAVLSAGNLTLQA